MPRIFERMRGLHTPIVDIRRRVFVELARLVLDGNATVEGIEAIPFSIIDKDSPSYRCCEFKERAIVRERVRLACGLDLREHGAREPTISDADKVLSGELFTEPLINVITIGCEKCPEDSIVVTDLCQNCLAHPCIIVCPVNAVSIIDGRSSIDQDKCINCMRCTTVCPYEAITRRGRPCAQACGVDAIYSDEHGFAVIDQDKCVSCGLCTVSCPFGAIADKSEILPVMESLKEKKEMHAIVAPSFVSQFGPKVTPRAIFEGLIKLGFRSVMEVAYGADIDVRIEAEKLARVLKESPDPKRGAPFLGTSCCPSWVMTARQFAPRLMDNISDSYTPMVETAKKVKETYPRGKVVFIGPCIAKKHERLQEPMASFVDHVVTFEELAAMFVAARIDLLDLSGDLKSISDATGYGRGYPVAGGVSSSIVEYAINCYPGLPGFDSAKADTLRECRKMLEDIEKGKTMPRLVEGMACPGGCIGGPGTLAPLSRARRAVSKFKDEAKDDSPAC